MIVAGFLVGVAAVAVSLVRWLRVSQREHYLAGQVLRTAVRWREVRPPNDAVAAGYVAVAVVALGVALAGLEPASLALGSLAAALGAVFPVGMSVRGKVPLRLTRRALTQGAIALLLVAVGLVLIGLVLHVGPAVGLAPLATALAVDAAAFVARPLERRLAGRFVTQARARLAEVQPRVIALTGSYGKTTVKNHIRDLLAGSFPTLASPASWNNQAGLARTINEHLAPGTEILVAEMGTYGPGEIASLVSWMRPDIAVICAIGPVHLERMGSLEKILEAKSEILSDAKVAVLCVDDAMLDDLAHRLSTGERAQPPELWQVGTDPTRTDLDVLVCPRRMASGADVADSDLGELTVFVRGGELASLPATGLHSRNVACAVAVALAAGAPRRAVVTALATLSPPSSRAQATVVDDLVIIDDTFNSNPSGARAALEMLAHSAPEGRRAVVTPGMVELGPVQAEANRDFAAAVAAHDTDLVIVGWTNRDALAAGHGRAVAVRDREQARAWVRDHLGAGDGVLWENDLPDHYP